MKPTWTKTRDGTRAALRISLLMACAVFAATELGCVPTQQHLAVAVPPEVLAPDCEQWTHVQETLADVALNAMQTLGRIDPWIYRRDDQGAFLLDATATPMPGQSPDAFQAALTRVNSEPAARDALARGLTAATNACANEACPPKVYSITVSRIETPFENDRLFNWAVAGEDVPTPAQWRGFLALYVPRPELCPFPDSLSVGSRASGLGQTSGLFNHLLDEEGEDALGNSCKCPYMGGMFKTTSCQYGRGYLSAQCTAF